MNDPAHFDPLILPREIQEIIVDRIGNLTDEVENYLQVKRRHTFQEGIALSNISQLQTFFQKTRAMDVTRKDNFEITFPEFYELIIQYE